jgi:hypothetical protein
VREAFETLIAPWTNEQACLARDYIEDVLRGTETFEGLLALRPTLGMVESSVVFSLAAHIFHSRGRRVSPDSADPIVAILKWQSDAQPHGK